jgi:hypothetical protein
MSSDNACAVITTDNAGGFFIDDAVMTALGNEGKLVQLPRHVTESRDLTTGLGLTGPDQQLTAAGLTALMAYTPPEALPPLQACALDSAPTCSQIMLAIRPFMLRLDMKPQARTTLLRVAAQGIAAMMLHKVDHAVAAPTVNETTFALLRLLALYGDTAFTRELEDAKFAILRLPGVHNESLISVSMLVRLLWEVSREHPMQMDQSKKEDTMPMLSKTLRWAVATIILRAYGHVETEDETSLLQCDETMGGLPAVLDRYDAKFAHGKDKQREAASKRVAVLRTLNPGNTVEAFRNLCLKRTMAHVEFGDELKALLDKCYKAARVLAMDIGRIEVLPPVAGPRAAAAPVAEEARTDSETDEPEQPQPDAAQEALRQPPPPQQRRKRAAADAAAAAPAAGAGKRGKRA